MVEVIGQKTGRMNYEKPGLFEFCPNENREDLIEGAADRCYPGPWTAPASCFAGSSDL